MVWLDDFHAAFERDDTAMRKVHALCSPG